MFLLTGYELIKELSDIFNAAGEMGLESEIADRFSKTALGEGISRIAQSTVAGSALCSLRKEINEHSAESVKTEAGIICGAARSIINNEFSNPNLSLLSAGRRLGVSTGHLSALMKKTTGENFKKLLIDRRMKEAARLLKTTDLKVFEVADRCGFSDNHYFSHSFKRFFLVTPKEYKFLHKY